jgi:hypothetical protein
MSNKLDENINVTRFSMKSVDDKLKFMEENINEYYKKLTKDKKTITIKGPDGKDIKAEISRSDPIYMIKFHYRKKSKNIDVWACSIFHGDAANTLLNDTDTFEGKNLNNTFHIRTKEQQKKPVENKIVRNIKADNKKLQRAAKMAATLKQLKDDNTIEIPDF